MNSSGKKPHILIFNPDQWRGDVLAHVGNPAAVTPHLDDFANNVGVSFRNAFVQATVCTPSRCSFMSGWYPHVRGHRTMFHMMHDDEPVLLRTLKALGYWVWWGGKNDLTPGGQSQEPFCSARSTYSKTMMPNLHIDNGWRGPVTGDNFYSFYVGRLDKKGSDMYIDSDWSVVLEAIEVIEQRLALAGNNPICLYLALSYPHPPYGVEEPYYSLIDRAKLPPRIRRPADWDVSGKSAILRGIWERQGLDGWSEERWTELRATYYGQCARVDHQFGMIMEALKRAGIIDDTAVFFFSDHGDYTGDYGLVEKNQNTFEDCLVRVPFLVKPPAWLPVYPRVSDALVELVDFSATVEDILGLEPEHTHFGKSLMTVIAGETDTHRDAVFAEGGRLAGEGHCMELESQDNQVSEGLYYPRLSLQREEADKGPVHGKATMVRTNRYKYVQRLYEKDELYDLVEDPGEQINRIDDSAYHGVCLELKERLLRFYLETSDVVPHKTDKRGF